MTGSVTGGYADRLVWRERSPAGEGKTMRGLLIAMLIGAVLAVGAGFGTGAVLSGATNGKPVNATLFNYGQR